MLWCGVGKRRCSCQGKGEVDVGSVLGPNTPTHFPTSPPFLSPHPFPTRQHTSPLAPYTLPHPSPHFSTPHTSFLTSPTPPPTPLISLPTAPLTSPYTPTHFPTHPHALSHTSPHIFLHSFDYVAKLPCDDVIVAYLNKFNWKSPINFFRTTRNLKYCFGVGNVNF